MTTDQRFLEYKEIWDDTFVSEDSDTESLTHIALNTAEKIVFKSIVYSAFEVVIALAVILFLFMRFLQTEFIEHKLFYAATVIGLITIQYLLVKWRAKFWKSPGLSLLENSKFNLSHLKFKMRMTYLTLIGGPIGLSLGLMLGRIDPLSPGLFKTHLVAFGLAVLILISLGVVKLFRYKKALVRASKMHSSLF